jgi:hypothetical protein
MGCLAAEIFSTTSVNERTYDTVGTIQTFDHCAYLLTSMGWLFPAVTWRFLVRMSLHFIVNYKAKAGH